MANKLSSSEEGQSYAQRTLLVPEGTWNKHPYVL